MRKEGEGDGDLLGLTVVHMTAVYITTGTRTVRCGFVPLASDSSTAPIFGGRVERDASLLMEL